MRAVTITALAVLLSGCTIFKGRQGGNVVAATPINMEAVAADTLVELVKLYPPAVSRLSIVGDADDAFGQELAIGLRKRGYAIMEAPRKGKADPSALPLRYVVDQPVEGYHRVMVRVGEQTLARSYAVVDGATAPSAGWALNLSGASPELVERAMRPDLPSDLEQNRTAVAAIDAGLVDPAIGEAGSGATGWRVQFATFRTEKTARLHWSELVQRKPSLGALTPEFPKLSRGLVVVQAGRYSTMAQAQRVCRGLSANECIVVKA